MSNLYHTVLGILHSLGLVSGLAGFPVFWADFHRSAWAGSWSDIQRRGYLIIAVKDNWPPLGFVEHGQLKGFEIDLARQLAQEVFGRDNAVLLKPVANVDRISAVTSGQVDLAIAGLSVTPARARLVDFSSSYYQSGIAIITKQPQIQRLAQLNQQPIAVLNQSTAIPWLKSELPTAKLVGVTSYETALAQLESGQVSAFAGDLTVLSGWVKTYPQYHRLPGLLSVDAFAVALPKGIQYDQLRYAVQSAIVRLSKNGWLQKRATFWGLPD